MNQAPLESGKDGRLTQILKYADVDMTAGFNGIEAWSDEPTQSVTIESDSEGIGRFGGVV